MTPAELLDWGTACLSRAEVPDAVTDAWILLSFVTGLTKARYLLCGREDLGQVAKQQKWDQKQSGDPSLEKNTADHWEQEYKRLIQLRCRRIPLQHLTEEQEFMGYSFLVNSHVLIPRQDTETLVEEALEELKEISRDSKKRQKSGQPKILDLCTGSGCIGISLKLLMPQAQVTVSDISGDALLIAEKNAKRLGARVTIVQSDLFAGLKETYDLILSNPPYIPTKVIETLMPEVKDHEPLLALDGGGDGLSFYKRIAMEAPGHLQEGGRLLLEIGHDQGGPAEALLDLAGFTQIRRKKDLAGLDRVVTGVYHKKQVYEN